VRFVTTLIQGEHMNVVGFVVPEDVVEALGGGKRPSVKVTINGYAYRNTVAVMGGGFVVGVAAEHRAKAHVAGGDTVEVQIELDTEPRTVEVPADLAAALSQVDATAAFEGLAFTYRKEHVRSVEDAKTPETRNRRIEAVVRKVAGAKRR